MSSSGKNIGTRVYLKRASPTPQVCHHHVCTTTSPRPQPAASLTHSAKVTTAGVTEAVQAIISDVRSNGVAGARKYAAKFDNWSGKVRMTAAAIAAAVASPRLRSSCQPSAHGRLPSRPRASVPNLPGQHYLSLKTPVHCMSVC